MSEELVWDTSSLSHAFEEYSHSAVSAYMSERKKALRKKYIVTWEDVKEALLRRHRSEYESRKMLSLCDGETYTCYIPEEVMEELRRSRRILHSARVLLDPYSVEEEYVRKNRLAEGFARVFRPRLIIERAPRSYVRRVIEASRQLGIKIHYADVYALALAMAKGATLVTGDGRLAELAKMLGVKVRYTLEAEKEKKYAKTTV